MIKIAWKTWKEQGEFLLQSHNQCISLLIQSNSKKGKQNCIIFLYLFANVKSHGFLNASIAISWRLFTLYIWKICVATHTFTSVESQQFSVKEYCCLTDEKTIWV